MIPVIILWFVLLSISMAHRKGGGRKPRRFREYLRGAIDLQVDLGTLAAATGIKTSVGDTVSNRAWVSSIKCTYSIGNVTPAAGVGPIQVLACHSDYTLAEVEEWIENTNSWSTADPVQSREVAKRLIRRVGTIGGGVSSAAEVMTMNDGKFVHTKLGWHINNGQTVAFVLYNMGSAAYATTDPDVDIMGHANLWPVN